MQKLLWFLIFIHFSVVNASEIDSVVDSIPIGERLYLNEFFKLCVQGDHFGYTIFFDKPVSASGFLIKCPPREIPSPYRNRLVSVGWKIWKKYEPLFTFSNYIFCEEIEEVYNEELKHKIKMCHIYLINKNALLYLLKDKLSIFREYLGENFSPEDFLLQIETDKKLTPHLRRNEALLGIVLGYGTQSSFKFAEARKRGKIPEEHSMWTPIVSYQPEGCKINPVIFIGDIDLKEDQAIKQHYSSQIDEIWNIYRNKEFLRQVIKQLCGKLQSNVD